MPQRGKISHGHTTKDERGNTKNETSRKHTRESQDSFKIKKGKKEGDRKKACLSGIQDSCKIKKESKEREKKKARMRNC